METATTRTTQATRTTAAGAARWGRRRRRAPDADGRGRRRRGAEAPGLGLAEGRRRRRGLRARRRATAGARGDHWGHAASLRHTHGLRGPRGVRVVLRPLYALRRPHGLCGRPAAPACLARRPHGMRPAGRPWPAATLCAAATTWHVATVWPVYGVCMPCDGRTACGVRVVHGQQPPYALRRPRRMWAGPRHLHGLRRPRGARGVQWPAATIRPILMACDDRSACGASMACGHPAHCGDHTACDALAARGAGPPERSRYSALHQSPPWPSTRRTRAGSRTQGGAPRLEVARQRLEQPLAHLRRVTAARSPWAAATQWPGATMSPANPWPATGPWPATTPRVVATQWPTATLRPTLSWPAKTRWPATTTWAAARRLNGIRRVAYVLMACDDPWLPTNPWDEVAHWPVATMWPVYSRHAKLVAHDEPPTAS